jgi:hypothetical protein
VVTVELDVLELEVGLLLDVVGTVVVGAAVVPGAVLDVGASELVLLDEVVVDDSPSHPSRRIAA